MARLDSLPEQLQSKQSSKFFPLDDDDDRMDRGIKERESISRDGRTDRVISGMIGPLLAEGGSPSSTLVDVSTTTDALATWCSCVSVCVGLILLLLLNVVVIIVTLGPLIIDSIESWSPIIRCVCVWILFPYQRRDKENFEQGHACGAFFLWHVRRRSRRCLCDKETTSMKRASTTRASS